MSQIQLKFEVLSLAATFIFKDIKALDSKNDWFLEH